MAKSNIWVCPNCTTEEDIKEFKTLEEYQDHMKKVHGGKVEPKKEEKPVKPPTPEPKPEKIELVYKYEGKCPNCRAILETIPLDTDKRKKDIYVIAWCPICKMKRDQKEVARL